MSRISTAARLAGRAASLPPRISARLLRGSLVTSVRMLRRSLVLSARSVQLAVRSSIVSFLVGVGVGWFLSTPTGRGVRAALLDVLRPSRGVPLDDDEVAAAVRTTLAGAPSTWHLPQPRVSVVGGCTTLTGEVPHATGRDALARVASGVAGVTEVVDQLVVGDSSADPSGAATDADPADGTPTTVR